MEKMHLIIACCEKSLTKLSLPFEVLPVCKHHACFFLMADRHSTNFKFTCCLAKASTWMKSSCFKNWAQKDAMKFCWQVLHKVAWIHVHLGDDKTHLWWWLFLLGFSRVCWSKEALCLQKLRNDILLKLASPTVGNALKFSAPKSKSRVIFSPFQGALIIRVLFLYSLLLATQIAVVA